MQITNKPKISLCNIEDMIGEICEDLTKTINISNDIDLCFFQKYNPAKSAEDKSFIVFRHEDYKIKMQIVMDYLCKVSNIAEQLLEQIMQLKEPEQ